MNKIRASISQPTQFLGFLGSLMRKGDFDEIENNVKEAYRAKQHSFPSGHVKGKYVRKMISRILHPSSAVIFLLSLISGCSSSNQSEYVLRASLLVNENHSWYKSMDYFGTILHERSKGRIQLELYPSEQLAKEVEAIRLIRAGVIDITSTSSTLNNWLEIAAFCEMPFLVTDTTEMRKLIQSPIGKRIELEILEKTGLRVLGYLPAGARHLTSNRPIRHPDELNGLILRVPNVPSFVTAWAACGTRRASRAGSGTRTTWTCPT